MLNVIFLILLSVTVLTVFLFFLFRKNIAPQHKRVLTLYVPLGCLFLMVCWFVANSTKRTIASHELDRMIRIVQLDQSFCRFYATNKDKYSCLDSLKILRVSLDSIIHENETISFVLGENVDISQKIKQLDNALCQQEKRLNRINDFIEDSVYLYNWSNLLSDELYIVPPITHALPYLDIAFLYKDVDLTGIVCTHVEMMKDDSIVYAANYVSNDTLNCYVIPNFMDSSMRIRLGFVTNGDERIFKYKEYARE